MGNNRNEPPPPNPNRRRRRRQRKTQMSPLLSSICFVKGDERRTDGQNFHRGISFFSRSLRSLRQRKSPTTKRGRGHFVEQQTCDGRRTGRENCRAPSLSLRRTEIERDRGSIPQTPRWSRSQDTEDESRKMKIHNIEIVQVDRSNVAAQFTCHTPEMDSPWS